MDYKFKTVHYILSYKHTLRLSAFASNFHAKAQSHKALVLKVNVFACPLC